MIKIYTDGAARGNGTSNARGGWAFICINNDNKTESYGYAPSTTNNRMELTAAIEGLKYIKNCYANQFNIEAIILYTDSAYLYNCWKDGWWKSWSKNGWKNSKKQPVINQDLWEILIPYFKMPNIKFEKVKGHSGHSFNDRVDFLATSAADTGISKI